jgi:hypothetical protein
MSAEMESRMMAVEAAVEDIPTIREAVVGIQKSLETLIRLEERQAEQKNGIDRAFVEIRDVKETVHTQGEKIQDLRERMPLVALAGRVTLAGCGLLMLAAIALIFSHSGLPMAGAKVTAPMSGP